MKRILSGIQPTGNLHLGNYLGAIRNWVAMQKDYECFYMLADLHAITVPQKPEELRAATREIAAALVACGIDPKTSIIFPQSAVAAHSELTWVLGCHTPLGWLNRMTQFKDRLSNQESDNKFVNEILLSRIKSESDPKKKERYQALYQNIDISNIIESDELLTLLADTLIGFYGKSSKVGLGLYSYPVLMAADILIYKATHVPVGEDQKQHLELARDIAGAFNRNYNTEFFPLPEPVIIGAATRVMSLRDGTKKMSKSEESDYSRINLTDDADAIALKFKKAKSDSEPSITYDPEKRPEAANLINIYAALSGVTREKVVAEFAGKQFSAFKSSLADLAIEQLSSITAVMRELVRDESYIDGILAEGARKANEIAAAHMQQVHELVGFLQV